MNTTANPSPEHRAAFMAECYAISPSLGQMSVSYTLLRSYNGDGGLRSIPGEISPHLTATLRYIAEGEPAYKEANQRGLSPNTVRTYRSELYEQLNIRHGMLGAARVLLEHRIVSFDPDPKAGKPPVDPWGLMLLDLRARDLSPDEVCILTGETSLQQRRRTKHTAAQLGLPAARKGGAIKRLYELGIFQLGLGLISSLGQHPGIIKSFDTVHNSSGN